MLAEAVPFIHVLIADSTRIHTELLAAALQRDPQLQTVLAGPKIEDVIHANSLEPFDVAIISSSLTAEPFGAVELVRALRASNPNLRLISLLDSCRPELIVGAFRAGARGILSREESLETLCKCVHRVYEGQVWASSGEITQVLDAFAACPSVHSVDAKGVELLSKREKQIVHALAEGLANREIAEQLGLSPHTVKNYLFRIFDKLGVSSRTELLSLTFTNHSSQHEDAPREKKDCAVCRSGVLLWLQSAADQGFVVAQCAMAHLYRVGQGVPRDLGLAYKWHLISEATCHDLPADLLAARREVGALLGTEQLRRAELAAGLWLEGRHNGGHGDPVVQELQQTPPISDRRKATRSSKSASPEEQESFASPGATSSFH